VIYVDTSVVLAYLLAEDRHPAEAFWDHPLIASRLLEYELWNRLHARELALSHGDQARSLLSRIAFAELAPPVLARALEPFPRPVGTLDGLHLSTAIFLRERDRTLRFATYDKRLAAAARSLKLSVLLP
jgi:predicted nucleic acid-binding protein